jgi:hypothetical protein
LISPSTQGVQPLDVVCNTDQIPLPGNQLQAPEEELAESQPSSPDSHLRKEVVRILGTLYIEHGSLWEKGYDESFNGKLRDELLNGEIFYNLKEAKVVVAGVILWISTSEREAESTGTLT